MSVVFVVIEFAAIESVVLAGAAVFCATAGLAANSAAVAIASDLVMRICEFLPAGPVEPARSNWVVGVAVVVALPPEAEEPEESKGTDQVPDEVRSAGGLTILSFRRLAGFIMSDDLCGCR